MFLLASVRDVLSYCILSNVRIVATHYFREVAEVAKFAKLREHQNLGFYSM